MGKAGWPLHPGPPRKKDCASARRPQVQRDHSGPPCAMVYGLYVLFSVNHCVCHRRPRVAFGAISENLAPNMGAPEPHDFAVRGQRRSSVSASTSTAFRSAFVTTRTPLIGPECADHTMDFDFGKVECFSRAGLTRFLGEHSSGKSVLQQT